jgi:hypothetical protein
LALTSQQIVTLATQAAKATGFTSQAGQLLNMILSDLCQTYDLAVALGTNDVTFTTGLGSGPYPLPSDYLRMANNEVFYYVDQVPYVMVNIDLSEFDALVQQPGISTYPENFATDPSQSPPAIYVWPPPAGSYVTTIRYYRQMPDITTPETSSTVPWFPNQDYLLTRLTGELMKITDDERAPMFLGEGPSGAQGILKRYLELQADDEGRAATVKLDRRRFGSSFNRLPNTKTLGW